MSITHLCVLLNAVGAGCHALTVHISLQLGKIGGRLRRQAVCLLAVVLDPVEEEAPALNKLLEQVPQVCFFAQRDSSPWHAPHELCTFLFQGGLHEGCCCMAMSVELIISALWQGVLQRKKSASVPRPTTPTGMLLAYCPSTAPTFLRDKCTSCSSFSLSE